MFINETSLPHLLIPSDYWTVQAHLRECELLRGAWHVVGATSQLAHPGDFITCEIAGVPVQVRNFDGRVEALSNVCAHRHSLISSRPNGNSPRMKCQYHGWEYQPDGRTGKIPEPKNFVPLDRERLCLPRYALETVGQLVFVNVAPNPKPINEFLGPEMLELLKQRFGDAWELSFRSRPEYPVNWKIPLENSLESYHVPNVHRATFKDDPGSERSEHVLKANRTSFGTSLPFAPHSKLQAWFQRMEGRFVAWMGREVTDRYWHHHVFPNLLISFTDAIGLVNCILPTGPKTSQAVVLQFGVLPARDGLSKRLAAWFWGKVEAMLIKKILVEDFHIFGAIQRGLETSPHAGTLGACEERIHAFQEYLVSNTSSLQVADVELPEPTKAPPLRWKDVVL